jgi:hypothetical protein
VNGTTVVRVHLETVWAVFFPLVAKFAAVHVAAHSVYVFQFRWGARDTDLKVISKQFRQ